MADWSALTSGFQQGANFTQDYRRKKQEEKYRKYVLDDMGRESFAKDEGNRDTAADYERKFGEKMPVYQSDNNLPDPLIFMLGRGFKNLFSRKKQQALPFESSAPDVNLEAPEMPQFEGDEGDPSAYEQMADGGTVGYADGGLTVEDLEKLNAQQKRNAQIEIAKGKIKDAAGKVGDVARKAIPAEDGLLRRALNSKVGRVGGALAVTSAIADQTDENADDRYAKRFGWDGPSEDQGDASFGGFLKYFGKRGLGFASDLGDKLTFGAAKKLFYRDDEDQPNQQSPQALPLEAPAAPAQQGDGVMQLSTTRIGGRPTPRSAPQEQNPMVNFGEIDIDPKDVPNLQTDDWRQYRMAATKAAGLRGMDPASAKEYADDQITRMQMKGFLGYGQQGLALQQAGNIRGAMAAYRAAFQYFPNGNDVEFGVSKNKRTGQNQIIGFGKDEKTGQVVKGSEMIMDPERVAVLLENFKNPSAFRAWTKDWRDFQQNLREYEEGKSVKEAMASAALTNAQANMTQAENYGLRYGASGAGGGLKQSDVRAAQEMFSQIFMEQGVTDPEEALQLGTVAIQLKQRQPQLSENQIAQAILQRYKQQQPTQ